MTSVPSEASDEGQTRRERRWIYVTVCIILAGVIVWAILAFSSTRENARAQEKADQLIAALEIAGLDPPARDQIVRVLSDDGGSTCESPNDALSQATLLAQLVNGATGPGSRPVIADSKVLQGQAIIIGVYCPDQLDEFNEFVDALKTSDVAETRS